MGFCTICGKELADGEVCSCQQNAQAATQPEVNNTETAASKSAANGIAVYVEYAKNVIKNPIEAAEEFFEKKSMEGNLTGIALSVIVYILASLLYVLSHTLHILITTKRRYMKGEHDISYSDVLDMLGITRGDILENYGITAGTFVQGFFFPIIYILFIVAALIIGIYVANMVVNKQKFDIMNVMSLCGVVSLPVAGAGIIEIISNFIYVSGVTGTIFAALQAAFGITAVVFGLKCVEKFTENKKNFFFTVLIVTAVLVIVNFLACLMLRHYDSWFLVLPL